MLSGGRKVCRAMFLGTLGYKSSKAISTVKSANTIKSTQGTHNSAGKRKWTGTSAQEGVKRHILSFEPGQIIILISIYKVITYI